MEEDVHSYDLSLYIFFLSRIALHCFIVTHRTALLHCFCECVLYSYGSCSTVLSRLLYSTSGCTAGLRDCCSLSFGSGLLMMRCFRCARQKWNETPA